MQTVRLKDSLMMTVIRNWTDLRKVTLMKKAIPNYLDLLMRKAKPMVTLNSTAILTMMGKLTEKLN